MADRFIMVRVKFFRLSLLGLMLLTFGCNAGWSNPFALPPAGKKITVMPRFVDGKPTDTSPVSLQINATIFSIKTNRDISNSGSPNGAVGMSEGLDLASISMSDSAGKVVKFSKEKILESNNSTECQGIASDVRDLLSLDKSLILICDKDMIASISAASLITIETEKSQRRDFTSWSTSWSEAGGRTIAVHSFSM